MRKDYVDISRGLAMLLVIAGHFRMDYGNRDVLLFITSFHMPLFFFINGLTIKRCDSLEKLVLGVKKRFLSLYIPYFVMAAIYCRPSLKAIFFILYGSNRSIHNSGGNGVLWFLPCMLVADILWMSISFLLYKAKPGTIRNTVKICSIILMIVISYVLGFFRPDIGYPFTVDMSLLGVFFIFIGGTTAHLIDEVSMKKSIILGGVALVATILLIPLNIIQEVDYDFGPQMAYSICGSYPIFIIQGVCGSLFVVFLSKGIGKNCFIQHMGKNTLVVLGVHQFIILIVETMISHLSISLDLFVYFIACIIVAVLSVISSELIIRVFLEQIKILNLGNRKMR